MMKKQNREACLLTLIVLLFTFWQAGDVVGAKSGGAPSITPHGAMPSLQGQPAIDYLKQRGLFESVRVAIEADQHEIIWQTQTDSGALGWKATNPGQNLEATFSRKGTLISPGQSCNSPSWQMALELRGVGYGDRLRKVVSGPMHTNGNKIEFQKLVSDEKQTAIIEWYVNKPDGIEQGFTIAEKPGSHFGIESLRVALSVSGQLRASIEDSGQAVVLSLENGREALRYDHLVAYDALGRTLPSRMEATADEISLLVDDIGAVYPVTIDPLFTEVKKIGASDGVAGDRFGTTLAISGDTVIVGAYRHNGFKGAAYIFERNKGGADFWGEVKKLTASDDIGADWFGWSVSMSGDTAIVGSPEKGAQEGAAYVFERNKGGADFWGEVKKLTASDAATFDIFGFSVAISGDTAIVGANRDDGQKGSAYVFERNKGGADLWGEVKKLTASDGAAFDNFGQSLAISVDTAIVGAPNDDGFKGSAYVFERNMGGADLWGQVRKLTASDGAANDFFGGSVGISGDTAIAGAVGDDSKGSAYVFERNKGGADLWGEVKKLTASDGIAGDGFSNSVAISGDTAIIGAQGADSAKGSAYIFERNMGGADFWGEVKELTASDGTTGDQFGWSVAISGGTAIVGAPLHQAAKGASYIFASECDWAEKKKRIASDNGAEPRFGWSVTISGDTAIVGTQNNTGKGAAYVFERNQGGADLWGEVKKLTASDGAAGVGGAIGDVFGFDVALSGDTAVIGAPGDDGLKGSVYIFQRNAGGANFWGEVKKLTASDGAPPDEFGHAVAISGDTVTIGAWRDNNLRGSAYIFERNKNGPDLWGEVKKLTASDGADGDWFGYGVALSGDTAIVGAYRDDGDKGAAYVFYRNQNGADLWGEVKKVTASDGVGGDSFGLSVGLSGDTAVIGAYADDGKGSAYVLERNKGGADSWGEVKKLTASDGAASDFFGISVDISYDKVIVGAWGDDLEKGSVYVFARNNGGADLWGEVTKLTASDGTAPDRFGLAVGISGDTAIIGAERDDNFTGSAYVFTCNPCAAITLSDLPDAQITIPYNQTVVALPAGTYTFAVVSGNLPLGLNLNPNTGAITGTPTQLGSSTFTISAVSGSCSGTRTYTITVGCPNISVTSLPNGTSGVAYSQQINVLPAGNYAFSQTAGTLPPFLWLNPATGVISGTASVPGTYNFVVTVQLTNGCSASQPLSITINCPTVTVNPATLPNGQIGTPYSQMLSALPGGSYVFSVAGSLPPGLALNATTGLLYGTPTANGTFNFTATATGAFGCAGSRSYTVTIAPGACPTVTLSALPGGKVGTLYVKYVTASPGGSYSYSLTGTLPPGLTFYSAIGLIYGYPTAAASYNFSVTATSINNCMGTRAYTVVIAP